MYVIDALCFVVIAIATVLEWRMCGHGCGLGACVGMSICGFSRRSYLLVAWATVDAASVAFTRSIYHLSVTI